MLSQLIDIVDKEFTRLNLTIQKVQGGRFAVILQGTPNDMANSELATTLQNNLCVEGTKLDLELDLPKHLQQYSDALSLALTSNAAPSIAALTTNVEEDKSTDAPTDTINQADASVDESASTETKDINDLAGEWE
jgi:hypothetical protein